MANATLFGRFALVTAAGLLPVLGATAQKASVQKQADGIVIHLLRHNDKDARTVRLQVVSDKIIHVQASPGDSIAAVKSLMVVAQKTTPAPWRYQQKKGLATISTAALRATVSLGTGAVSFTDLQGRLRLRERPHGGKAFTPITLEGQPLYRIEQVFSSPEDEGLYGLGQHQNGTMNYRGQQVELAQNNTGVAVPFLVSSRNYGILWDNYSITKVGHTRDYEPLSTLKLYAKDGQPGWLTATYARKDQPAEIVV